MIANYFKLQVKILKRYIVEAGLPVFILYPALILLYTVLYQFVRLYPTWGAYLLVMANFQYLFSLSDFKRNDFLKTVFPKAVYYKVRILENVFISFGSLIILCLNGNYLIAVALLSFCILFIFTSAASIWKRSIPTPFTKKPFEFILGFRRTWLLLLLLYIISTIASTANNLNLILFCMFCICLCCIFYYQTPEPILVHWNQSRKATSFLHHKIGRAVAQLSLLLCPLLLLVAVCYPEELYKALIVWLLGIILIPFIISLKYAVFPRAINATEATVLSLCIIFHPLILAVIPYYYFKAVHNLKRLA